MDRWPQNRLGWATGWVRAALLCCVCCGGCATVPLPPPPPDVPRELTKVTMPEYTIAARRPPDQRHSRDPAAAVHHSGPGRPCHPRHRHLARPAGERRFPGGPGRDGQPRVRLRHCPGGGSDLEGGQGGHHPRSWRLLSRKGSRSRSAWRSRGPSSRSAGNTWSGRTGPSAWGSTAACASWGSPSPRPGEPSRTTSRNSSKRRRYPWTCPGSTAVCTT